MSKSLLMEIFNKLIKISHFQKKKLMAQVENIILKPPSNNQYIFFEKGFQQ